MSATYRQSSNVRKELVKRDPQNVLLARLGRFRLEAEVVRDSALASSGLLTRTVGGPSIRPPQPAYVTSISRNADWKVSTGAEKYRRGLYILFRRATPYPMLLAFDAPDSNASCTRRERSNSPLQALTLLNVPVFFECALALGARLANEKQADDEDRLETAYLRCVGREPTDAERQRLLTFYREQHKQLAKSVSKAKEISGATKGEEDEAVDRAAWTAVARVLMNLDEFITREKQRYI